MYFSNKSSLLELADYFPTLTSEPSLSVGGKQGINHLHIQFSENKTLIPPMEAVECNRQNKVKVSKQLNASEH